MNSSKEFSPAELAALMPWRLPLVGELEEEQAEPPADEAPPPEVEDVEALVMPTAEEIEAIQREAREEAAREGFREGYDRGYQEGYEKGREQGYGAGRDEVDLVIAHLRGLLDGLAEPLQAVDEQVEQELAALAVALARQLIRRELKSDPGQIVAVAREALGVLPSSSRKVNLYLHPDDLELVRSVLAIDEDEQRWKLVGDPLLTRGGCRVVSEVSVIDASVEKRMAAAIAQAFGGERGGDEA
jgi:flagellar assembly protein FliH